MTKKVCYPVCIVRKRTNQNPPTTQAKKMKNDQVIVQVRHNKPEVIKARNNAILRQLDTQLPEELFIQVVKHLRSDKLVGDAKKLEDQLTMDLELFLSDRLAKGEFKA